MSSRDEEELPGNGNPENDFNDRRAIFFVLAVETMVWFVFDTQQPRFGGFCRCFFLNEKLILSSFAF